MPDILFIMVLALVIFGPKRLPEIARQIAKYMAQFRVMRDDLKRQLEGELLKIDLEEKQKAPTAATVQPPPPPLAVPQEPPKELPSTTPSQAQS